MKAKRCKTGDGSGEKKNEKGNIIEAELRERPKICSSRALCVRVVDEEELSIKGIKAAREKRFSSL